MKLRWISLGWLISCGAPPEDPDELLRARVTLLEGELSRYKKQADDCAFELDIAEAEVSARREQSMPDKVKAVRRALGMRIGKGLSAVLQTRLGTIRCELFPERAPETVRNFVELAEGRKAWTDPTGESQITPLYPGTIFHRVLPGVLIQGGDPKQDGTGGPGFTLEDEERSDFDRPGLLAMANHGRNTAGSQFFITLAPSPHLNGKYTVFGECDLGTVRKIAAEPLTKESKPEEPVSIEKLTIERG